MALWLVQAVTSAGLGASQHVTQAQQSLRQQTEAGGAAAQAHLLKFFHALKAGVALTEGQRGAMSRYVSAFSAWGEEARVERYGELHYVVSDAEAAGADVRGAVLAHIEEATPPRV